ncbi:putative molybdenum carrier protein [Marinobacter sp.]|uniref:YpsA SLOG family protein n=1 Tax=Marinobacter sp. TaxID=50741 RepID=UPI00345BA775
MGGSCPVGRRAEDGPVSSIYTLTEIRGGYRQRTKQKVVDSDGTAIFYESYVRGGTEATVLFCIRQGKPYKLIDIEVVEPDRAEIIHTNACSPTCTGRPCQGADLGVMCIKRKCLEYHEFTFWGY